MDILINKEKFNFTENDFPMLIHGRCKTGASHFSVCLAANLTKNNMKVIFFTAYPEAKDEFRKEINNDETNAIIINSGEEEVFIETLKNVPDLSERVILIKNIENYTSKLFEVVRRSKFVIFSGDMDKCEFVDELIKKDFNTKIFFSQLEKYPQDGLEDLLKYHGKIISKIHEGTISLDAG